MVDKIVKSDKTLLNSKKIIHWFIEAHTNTRLLIAGFVEGVRHMTYMSETINFKTFDYMFYENNRGFHFRCLESLYRESV